jgi:zinc transport system permease protein
MFELLQYPFLARALAAGAVVSLMLGWLGVFVTVRKMSFIGDGLAHSSLAGIALAILLGWAPLPTAVASSVIIAGLIYFFEKKTRISADSAIAVMFTTGMAIGVVLLNFYQGYQPELVSYLFGNILTVNNSDLLTIALFGSFILSVLAVFHKKMLFSTVDPEGAYLSGLRPWVYDLLLYIMTAVAVVLSIKLVGIVLVSALLVTPSAIARQYAGNFKMFTAATAMTSFIIVIFGLILSFYLDLPSGAAIVLFGSLIFFVGSGIRFFVKNTIAK